METELKTITVYNKQDKRGGSSMTQHTPAPWVAKEGRSIIHIHGNDGYIASVDTTHRDGMVPFAGVADRTRANANLIASAPQLLATAESLLAYIEVYLSPSNGPLLDDARNVIAKAKGE